MSALAIAPRALAAAGDGRCRAPLFEKRHKDMLRTKTLIDLSVLLRTAAELAK